MSLLSVRRTTRRRLSAGLAAAAAVAAVVAPAAVPAAPAAAASAPQVFTWGNNDNGQLGNGTTTENDTPAPVAALPAGTRQAVQLEEGFSVLALNADGTVSAWGSNDNGQLGDGTTTNRLSPVSVSGLTGITQVAGGLYHGLALDSSGSVWAWGDNTAGQLGDGTTTARSVPAKVPGLTGVSQLAASDVSSFALRSDGTVWAWGDNTQGELGDGTTVQRDSPQQVPGLTGITQITAGGDTAFAIRSDQTLVGWGDNRFGGIGDGTTIERDSPGPVPGLSGVTQVSTSGLHTLAIAGSNGQVWAWGDNTEGELGDGTTVQRDSPEQIGLTGATEVYAGLRMSSAVRSDGALLDWGDNFDGRLGYPTPGRVQPTPAAVTALASVIEAQVTRFGSVAIGRPAPPPPPPSVSVPDLTGLDRGTASAQLHAAELVLGTVRTLTDPTCQNIGKVEAQDPGPGSGAPVGSAVAVWLGARPRSGCHGG
jgi:alpha-tubulin suppressor-like RCC1 family protein